MPNTTESDEKPDGNKDFADRVTLGMPMSKREVIDAFLAHFTKSSEANVLAAFINLRFGAPGTIPTVPNLEKGFFLKKSV